MTEHCTLCRGIGWVLDGNPDKRPLTLELLPCPDPECTVSGDRIEILSVNEAGFDQMTRRIFRDEWLVMSLGCSAVENP